MPAETLLPLLAVADHGAEHPRVDRHPPQAPRQMRNRRRPAQPGHQGPVHRAAQRRRAVPRRSANPETLRIYGKNCPEDWIERNLYTRYRWAASRSWPSSTCCCSAPSASPSGRPDDVDSVLGRRRGQRPGPCHRLPQLRMPRRGHQPGALGHHHRR
jgi:hypothetical protein